MTAKIIGNSDKNADPAHHTYIKSTTIRERVNAALENLTRLATQAERGDRFAEAGYHRAAAELIRIRPARFQEDEIRQKRTSAHLNRLADRLDAYEIDTAMRAARPTEKRKTA